MKRVRAQLVGAALSILFAIAACAPIYRDHGYVPAENDLKKVVVGQSTREDVADLVGRPSSTGLLAGSGWYYVQSRFVQKGGRAPVEIDREVVAITFDEKGVVENVERFGLEKGQVVVLQRRVTDSNIKGIGFLKQLFGNIGNFTADQFTQ
ncbi:MAG: outer membrane protein assembly factor BamE [Rhodobacteraceae bacterium]|nr:outer membrane protein assembly factor BamE [Paracoccaceae bacterium]